MVPALRSAPSAPPAHEVTPSVALAVALVAYNTLTNVTRADDRRWYVTRHSVVGVLLLTAARHRGLTWDELGLAPAGLRAAWRHGLPVAVAVAGGVMVAAALGRRRTVGRRLLTDRRADVGDRELAWQALVRIPVGTAAFEEVAFRGVLYALLARSAGTPAALAGSSVAFGLWHIGPTLAALRHNDAAGRPAGPVTGAVAATMVAGLALAGLRAAADHLVPCWLAHWASNAVGLTLAARWQRRAGAVPA